MQTALPASTVKFKVSDESYTFGVMKPNEASLNLGA